MPSSVRQIAIDAIRTNLLNITKANGYTRNISANQIHGIVETPTGVVPPAVMIMQGEELVINKIGDRYECVLEVGIGFVDLARDKEGDRTAVSFMQEIQDVIPIEFNVTCPIYPSGNEITYTVQMQEVGNTMNVTAATAGLCLGQIVYELQYRRSVHNPAML